MNRRRRRRPRHPIPTRPKPAPRRFQMDEERERFFSRLATIPGLRTMPSIGAWILVEVDNPAEVARKVNRRLTPGIVSVPRNVPGAVRLPVRDPKANEQLFVTIRDLLYRKARKRYFQELRQVSLAAK